MKYGDSVYVLFPPGLPGAGAVPAEFMLVGMAPSPNRPLHRRLEPFGARSWGFVSTLIQNAPGPVYVTNLVKEPVPAGRKLGAKRIRYWLPALQEEVRLVNPRRILALGTEVAAVLCPGFSSMVDGHGLFYQCPDLVRADGTQPWIVPTYHLSAAARNPELWPTLQRDISRFFELGDPEYVTYQLINNPAELTITPGATVCLDVETDGLGYGARILQLGIAEVCEQPVYYIIPSPSPEQVTALGRRLKEQLGVKTLLGSNLAFDIGVLLVYTQGQFPRFSVEDTMLQAHTAGEETAALKHLIAKYTSLPGRGGEGKYADPIYLAEDLHGTIEVARVLEGARSFFYQQILCPLVPMVAAMHYRGVHVQYTGLHALRERALADVAAAEATLNELAGIPAGQRPNWASPQQVQRLLLNAGVALTERTASGTGFSTAEHVLLALRDQHPVVAALLDFRARVKLLTGFIEPYLAALTPEHQYLHPRFKLNGTVTGRISCADPNLQQVPKSGPLKTLFTSRYDGGRLCLIDLAQAELRVAALLSSDPVLLEALLTTDPHRHIAALILGVPAQQVSETQRKFFKRVTFGLLYGGTAAGIAARAGLSTEEVAAVVTEFFSKMGQLAATMRSWVTEALSTKALRTPFGLVRSFETLLEHEGENSVRRKALNTPVQGTASGILLWILWKLDEALREARGSRTRPVLTIHDSIILDVAPGEEDLLVAAATQAFRSLRETPLAAYPFFAELPFTGEVKVGPSWAAVEETSEFYDAEVLHVCSSI
jgi:uracil-DNA glycosylase family 4